MQLTNWRGNPVSIDWVCEGVGPGWHPIIRDLVNDLELMGWSGQVQQVKEKFGSLRFYISGIPEGNFQQVQNRISQASMETSRTCEECGKPGTLRTHSWLKVRCDACENIFLSNTRG